MRRGILLSSRRSATRTYGRRDFARLAHACVSQRRSWGSASLSQVWSPRRVTLLRFRAGPARVSFTSASSSAVFADFSSARSDFDVVVRRFQRKKRGCAMCDFRASLPSKIRITRYTRACDPALGFLSSCRVSDASGWMRIRRGLDTATDRQVLQPLSRPYPLLGFRRPSCANAPAILHRLIHLHGAVFDKLRRRRPFSVLRT
jgi:hypothetical protein